ncbi:hypothetical protein AJ78_03628 [Emergomyces pasteurianus Ep9510]|uniref:Uncharacterized protein n=1 Tax=Emergomyces pasteurianus Ep9510 TaxID=1447872 RepID=A0A1J9QJX1_9EURO|nr:hypothetical protein AJ78_03628 [Emergomyces pasteurianus Ep9510]
MTKMTLRLEAELACYICAQFGLLPSQNLTPSKMKSPLAKPHPHIFTRELKSPAYAITTSLKYNTNAVVSSPLLTAPSRIPKRVIGFIPYLERRRWIWAFMMTMF